MSRPRAAIAGAVAAIAALGVSELLAGLVEEVPSLILGVAELFVDETPGGIVRWSIDLFGGEPEDVARDRDRRRSPLALGALFGVLTRRSFATGSGGLRRVRCGRRRGLPAVVRSTRRAGHGSPRSSPRARESRRSGSSRNPPQPRRNRPDASRGGADRRARPAAVPRRLGHRRGVRRRRADSRRRSLRLSRSVEGARGEGRGRARHARARRSRPASPRSTAPSTASRRSSRRTPTSTGSTHASSRRRSIPRAGRSASKGWSTPRSSSPSTTSSPWITSPSSSR